MIRLDSPSIVLPLSKDSPAEVYLHGKARDEVFDGFIETLLNIAELSTTQSESRAENRAA